MSRTVSAFTKLVKGRTKKISGKKFYLFNIRYRYIDEIRARVLRHKEDKKEKRER